MRGQAPAEVELSNVVSVLLSNGLELTALELLHELNVLDMKQPDDLVRHFDGAPSLADDAAPIALGPLLPAEIQSALVEALPLIDSSPPPPPVPPRLVDFEATYASLKQRDDVISALRHELHVSRRSCDELQARLDELREERDAAAAAMTAQAVHAASSSLPPSSADAPPLGALDERRINCMLQRYLLDRGYRATAIAMAGEAPYLGGIRACAATLAAEGDAPTRRAAALRKSLDLDGVQGLSIEDLYCDRLQPHLPALELAEQLEYCELRIDGLESQVDGLSTACAAEGARSRQLEERLAAVADDAAPLGADELAGVLRWEINQRSAAADGADAADGVAAASGRAMGAADTAVASAAAATSAGRVGTAADAREEKATSALASVEGEGDAATAATAAIPAEIATRVGDATGALAAGGGAGGVGPDLGELIELLRELVPELIGSMVLTERRKIAPLLVAVCRLQTQQERRGETAAQLLSLAWRPDAAHRAAIARTWAQLQLDVGARSAVDELFPLILRAANDRFPEQVRRSFLLCLLRFCWFALWFC